MTSRTLLRRLPLVIAALAVAVAAAACGMYLELQSVPRQADLSKPVRDRLPDGTLATRYLVVFRSPTPGAPAPGNVGGPGRPGAPAPDSIALYVRREGGLLRHVYSEVFPGFSAALPESAADRLRQDPAVETVTPVIRGMVQDEQANPTWGLDRVDQRSGVLDKKYVYGPTGLGVNVYVLDTGIRTSHQDIQGRASFFYDVFGGNGLDAAGHGTHVAGTVAGTVHGVAKKARVWSVRVVQSSTYTTDDLIKGFDEVIRRHAKPAVINVSLGGPREDLVDRAAAKAVEKGITVVVAAGNEQVQACNRSPARAPDGITVAGARQNGAIYSQTNRGPCVDLFAPAVGIVSAWHASDAATMARTGTSMAAPHVTGAAALYLQGHPAATPAQVVAHLRCTATAGSITAIPTNTPNLLLFTRAQPQC